MGKETLKPVVSGIQGVPESMEILDLSAVPTRTQNMVDPRMTIAYTGYVAQGSALGAEEVKKAAMGRNLASPMPAALALVPVEGESNALRGIPSLTSEPAFLGLDWIEQGRRFRANMMALLQFKRIQIPRGTKMVITIRYEEEPKLGPCVKLSWAGDCFVPINELDEDEAKKDVAK